MIISNLPSYVCYRSRRENLSKARACAASGQHSAALEFYQRSMDISPAVAKNFIEVVSRFSVLVRPQKLHSVLVPMVEQSSLIVHYYCTCVHDTTSHIS